MTGPGPIGIRGNWLSEPGGDNIKKSFLTTDNNELGFKNKIRVIEYEIFFPSSLGSMHVIIDFLKRIYHILIDLFEKIYYYAQKYIKILLFKYDGHQNTSVLDR